MIMFCFWIIIAVHLSSVQHAVKHYIVTSLIQMIMFCFWIIIAVHLSSVQHAVKHYIVNSLYCL